MRKADVLDPPVRRLVCAEAFDQTYRVRVRVRVSVRFKRAEFWVRRLGLEDWGLKLRGEGLELGPRKSRGGSQG